MIAFATSSSTSACIALERAWVWQLYRSKNMGATTSLPAEAPSVVETGAAFASRVSMGEKARPNRSHRTVARRRDQGGLAHRDRGEAAQPKCSRQNHLTWLLFTPCSHPPPSASIVHEYCLTSSKTCARRTGCGKSARPSPRGTGAASSPSTRPSKPTPKRRLRRPPRRVARLGRNEGGAVAMRVRPCDDEATATSCPQ
jgi:hypothetical protein